MNNPLPESTGTEATTHVRSAPSSRLIGLNIALLAVLGVVTFLGSGVVNAQSGSGAQGATRGRGEYGIIAGRAQGVSTSVIYLFDSANQELISLIWNRNNNQAEIVGYRNMADDQKYQQRPR